METVQPPSHGKSVSKTFISQQTEEKRRRTRNVNLNQENSLLFSAEVILDAPFAPVMKGIDHSDRLLMMTSFMSCVFKRFVSWFCAYLRFIFRYWIVFFSFPSLGSPSSSSIFSLVIYFLLASCIIPFASASGEPCAPSLPASIHPSLLTVD